VVEEKPRGAGSNGYSEPEREELPDVIALRLPPKLHYLPVVRAAMGVIAGDMSFNYDEIVQLRVAVSEAFDLAVKAAGEVITPVVITEVEVRFTIALDRLEVNIPYPREGVAQITSESNEESLALLKSLVDEVELTGGAAGTPLIRLLKYRKKGGT
jgi:anti-sigma regulatory factor (Ser/Thr protein kinase)